MDLNIKTLFLNEERKHGKRKKVIIFLKNKSHRNKKRLNSQTFRYTGEILEQPQFSINSRHATHNIRKLYSIPNFKDGSRQVTEKRSYSLTYVHQNKIYKNAIQQKINYNSNSFTTQRNSVRLHIYRCEFGPGQDGCCCSCNSEAMFEVMKGLYDCYKKKNCEDCNCILCSHIPPEERHTGEPPKSIAGLTGPAAVKARKEMAKRASKALIGKTPEEKEKLIRALAAKGAPLPEGKTDSDIELIKRIRREMGLPAEPKTAAEKERLKKAEEKGLIVPLEGKSAAQKKKIIQQQIKLGVPLPEGRTPSEKALIQKVKEAEAVAFLGKDIPPEKLNKARDAGLLTPLDGKTPEQKEQILRGLAQNGIPLPEGKTASDKKLIEKVRTDLGLPPKPTTEKEKAKYRKAVKEGIISPLEGKSPSQKEVVLKREAEAGILLPEGRTPSEKALIKGLKKATPSKAKLEGTPTEQKEKILRGLVANHIPLPEGKTASEKKLIDKIRTDLGLPPMPSSESGKEKYNKATADGLITPLKGKTTAQKEKILKNLFDAGLPLPKARTPSEKALIKKIRAGEKKVKGKEISAVPSTKDQLAITASEKMRKARKAGLISPLEGKTPKQKEKILRSLALQGLPLPEGKTPSEKKLIDKVRHDMGLPPEPKTSSMRAKYAKAQADGLIIPLEGKNKAEKEKILRAQAQAGLPLPEGRTASERKLINKIKAEVGELAAKESPAATPSEKLRKAKEAGLITPTRDKAEAEQGKLEVVAPAKEPPAKTPTKPGAEREKYLRNLVKQGKPLPEGKTPSEKKLIEKVRHDMGLPPEPKTSSMRAKYAKAQTDGLITPLEGKNAAQKEKILRAQFQAGLPLPAGRTSSEKALIKRIKGEAGAKPSPLSSEARILDEKTRKVMKEGKGPSDECICGKLTPESEKRSVTMLPPTDVTKPLKDRKAAQKEAAAKAKEAKAAKEAKEAREAQEAKELKRKAKEAEYITPSKVKTLAQREKILRGLAEQGEPLPEGKTASEKKLIEKVRHDMGLPPEPKTSSMKAKYAKAQTDGLIIPLEGKTTAQKEKILRAQAQAGLSLPEGRTASERKLIDKIKAEVAAKETPSEKLRKAKAAGLISPPKDKEKILRDLVKQHKPLPEGKTASEKKLIAKVRHDMGLPPEPKTSASKTKYTKALTDGIITPLEGKTHEQKEKSLKALLNAGIPLPEGRTASEKKLIKKLKETASKKSVTKSKKIGIGDIEKTDQEAKEVEVKPPVGKEVGMKQAGIGEEVVDVSKTTTCERACGCDKKKIKFKHSYVKIKVTSPDISSLCPCPNECVPGVKDGVFVDNEGIKVTVGSVVGFPSYAAIKNEDSKSKPLLSYTSSHSSYVIEEIYSNVPNRSLNKQHLSEDLDERQNNENDNFYEYMIDQEFMIDQLNEYEESRDDLSRNEISESESLQSYTYESNVYGSMESIEASLFMSGTEPSLSFSASVTSSEETIECISVNSSNIYTSSHYLAYREASSSDSFNHKKSDCTSNDDLLVTKSSDRLLLRQSKNKPIIVMNDVKNSRELMELVKLILTKRKINNTSSVVVVTSSFSEEKPEFVPKTDGSSICIRMPKNYFNKGQNNTIVAENVECSRLKGPHHCNGHRLKYTSVDVQLDEDPQGASHNQGIGTFTQTNFKQKKRRTKKVS